MRYFFGGFIFRAEQPEIFSGRGSRKYSAESKNFRLLCQSIGVAEIFTQVVRVRLFGFHRYFQFAAFRNGYFRDGFDVSRTPVRNPYRHALEKFFLVYDRYRDNRACVSHVVFSGFFDVVAAHVDGNVVAVGDVNVRVSRISFFRAEQHGKHGSESDRHEQSYYRKFFNIEFFHFVALLYFENTIFVVSSTPEILSSPGESLSSIVAVTVTSQLPPV